MFSDATHMTNRHDRRREQAKLRQAQRDVLRPDYNPITDPDFLKGIAITVRSVVFYGSDPNGGLCMLRALVGLQALQNCNVDASLHIGSLLCRVGPDERRDTITFCGPGNAGRDEGFHAWIEVGDHILDFSVGDWRGLDPVANEIAAGLTPGEPVQWTVLAELLVQTARRARRSVARGRRSRPWSGVVRPLRRRPP